jgi:hypothetical protein
MALLVDLQKFRFVNQPELRKSSPDEIFECEESRRRHLRTRRRRDQRKPSLPGIDQSAAFVFTHRDSTLGGGRYKYVT